MNDASLPKLRIEFSDDSKLFPLDLDQLENTLLKILTDHERTEGLLSVAFVDDARIREVHRDFLGKDSATDCISFLLDEEEDDGFGIESEAEVDLNDSPFGEVIVSLDTAKREAEARGLEPTDEAALYAIHGTLHLVGYDDLTDEAEPLMREKEREYMGVYRGKV